jgi:hypothetical protein
MSKNPFEIRLELLKMAKEMADQQMDMTNNAYWSMVTTYAEQANKTVEEVMKATEHLRAEMYTPADIMAKANELYNFINKKD